MVCSSKYIPLIVLLLICSIVYPSLAQDMKSFTFHTDATTGDGTEYDITGLTLIGVTVKGSVTSNRSVTFEVADNITPFTATKCINVDTLTSVSDATVSGDTPQRFQCPVGGFKKFRVRITGGTTGSISAVGLGLAKSGGGSRSTTGSPPPVGSAILLDLGNSGPIESTSLEAIATTGDTNNIFTEPSPNKLLIDVSKKWSSSAIADALAVNGNNCPAGQAAGGVDALGNAEDCFTPVAVPGSTTFSGLTSGTNTAAAMICSGGCSMVGNITANALSGAINIGSGVSITPSGLGTVTATSLIGPATTALALATNPTACPATRFVTDMDANGTLTCAQPSSSDLSDAANIATLGAVQVLQNKEIVPREVVMTPVANEIEPNCASVDVVAVNALSANLTVKNPLCTPKASQELDFRFFCSAQRLLFWGNKFSITAGVPLLNVCTGDGSTFDYIKFRWNTVNSFWESVAVKATGKGVATLTSSTTFTPPADVASRVEMQMTGATGTLTVAAPSPSTPANGDLMWLAFQCTNLQTFSWNAIYLDGIYQTKPTTCPANVNTWLEVLVRYSNVESGWVVLVGASMKSVTGTTNEIDVATTSGAAVASLAPIVNLTSKVLRVPNSTTRPATCTVGDAYMDTDATTGQRWYLCETTNTWVVQGGGGSSSFTVTKNIPITGVKFPATNAARLDRSGNSDKLLFDAAVDQCIAWQFIWPTDWTSGGTMRLNGSMVSATSGSVNYNFFLWKNTPGSGVSVDTESYDSANACNTATVPGTIHAPFTVTCALTNKDGVAAGDDVLLKLCRAATVDSATGDGEVGFVELSYVH